MNGQATRQVRRWPWIAMALTGGLALGAAGMVAVQRPGATPISPAGRGASPATTTAIRANPAIPAAPSLPAASATPPAGGEGTLLMWTPTRLPPGLGAGVARLAGVDRVTSVDGGPIPMGGSWDGEGLAVDRPPPGLSFDLDTMAYDPATYPAFLPPSIRSTFQRLGADQAIIGASSAQLRRLSDGSTLEAGGVRLTVAAVVDDRYVGATELTVTKAGAARLSPRLSPEYLLVGYRGDRAGLEQEVRSLLPTGVPVRFRAPGETPFLRQGDAVLAQVFIKLRFGEFAYRLGPGRQIVQDQAWAADNIVVATVPILGPIRCHRALIAPLQSALGELEQRNLAFLVDKASYEGCWNPVLIAPGGELSRHAWGAAVDLNYAKNPTGTASGQDPRLVQVMERWGFTWGGAWLVPDPSHFEYLRPPQA